MNALAAAGGKAAERLAGRRWRVMAEASGAQFSLCGGRVATLLFLLGMAVCCGAAFRCCSGILLSVRQDGRRMCFCGGSLGGTSDILGGDGVRLVRYAAAAALLATFCCFPAPSAPAAST